MASVCDFRMTHALRSQTKNRETGEGEGHVETWEPKTRSYREGVRMLTLSKTVE